METLTLNVRVDANDKKGFEKFCNNVGMNVSTAINMFIKAVLRDQKLPFEVKTNTLAETEMSNSSKRYSKEEILESIDNIL